MNATHFGAETFHFKKMRSNFESVSQIVRLDGQRPLREQPSIHGQAALSQRKVQYVANNAPIPSYDKSRHDSVLRFWRSVASSQRSYKESV